MMLRCEDICWIRTNNKNSGTGILDPKAVLARSKEHCLMGIKGTVRRSTDGDFIHANVDIDLIIDEEPVVGFTTHNSSLFASLLLTTPGWEPRQTNRNVPHRGTLLPGQEETSRVWQGFLHQVSQDDSHGESQGGCHALFLTLTPPDPAG